MNTNKIIQIMLGFLFIVFIARLVVFNGFIVKADDFGQHNDAYYCHFIPVVGIFIDKLPNNNSSFSYDSSKVVGEYSNKINQYTIKNLANIYVGSPHRYNKALDVVAPPKTAVKFGLWGYSYAGHSINVKKVFIPLSLNSKGQDITRIIDIVPSSNFYVKNTKVEYTISGKHYSRQEKYAVYDKKSYYQNNVFYKGKGIGSAIIKAPLQVTHSETMCRLDSNGNQYVDYVVKIKNSGQYNERYSVFGVERTITSNVTQDITSTIVINRGIKGVESIEQALDVLDYKKECASIITNNGLNPLPVTKQIMVFRDDTSYSQNWSGTQPGFSVTAGSSTYTLCVTRMPYRETFLMPSCSFPMDLDIGVEHEGCFSTGGSSRINIVMQNKGIDVDNVKIEIIGNRPFEVDNASVSVDKISDNKYIMNNISINAFENLRFYWEISGYKVEDIQFDVNVYIDDKVEYHREVKVPACVENTNIYLEATACAENDDIGNDQGTIEVPLSYNIKSSIEGGAFSGSNFGVSILCSGLDINGNIVLASDDFRIDFHTVGHNRLVFQTDSGQGVKDFEWELQSSSEDNTVIAQLQASFQDIADLNDLTNVNLQGNIVLSFRGVTNIKSVKCNMTHVSGGFTWYKTAIADVTRCSTGANSQNDDIIAVPDDLGIKHERLFNKSVVSDVGSGKDGVGVYDNLNDLDDVLLGDSQVCESSDLCKPKVKAKTSETLNKNMLKNTLQKTKKKINLWGLNVIVDKFKIIVSVINNANIGTAEFYARILDIGVTAIVVAALNFALLCISFVGYNLIKLILKILIFIK